MESLESLIKRLKRSGLNDKAAILYAHLLELGGAYPSHLAEITKINRSTVYKVLVDLSVKGLTHEIQKGKKLYYQTGKPASLLQFARRQVNTANEMYEEARDISPEIERLYSALPNKPRVLYLEGPKEVLTVYDDFISQQKPYEMVAFGSAKRAKVFFSDSYYKQYRQAKEKKGITTRIILPDTRDDRDYANKWHSDVSKKIRPQARFITPEQFPFEGEITVYGEAKVAIVNLDVKHVTAIVIEDASYHKAMRTVFELAWKGAESK